jgi:hypothetical protein
MEFEELFRYLNNEVYQNVYLRLRTKGMPWEYMAIVKNYSGFEDFERHDMFDKFNLVTVDLDYGNDFWIIVFKNEKDLAFFQLSFSGPIEAIMTYEQADAMWNYCYSRD